MSSLVLMKTGCCSGHACDNCKTCQSGRCCRRDNPDYKLPELGEWDGPIYGELGVLNDDGEKVECHFCGGYFVRVALHAWKAHDLTASEYKAIIGLRRRAGLYAPDKHKEWSETHQNLKMFKGSSVVNATPEQRSDWGSRPVRLQARFAPEYADMRKERAKKARAVHEANLRERAYCKNGHKLTPENLQMYRGRRLCRLCRRSIKQRYNVKVSLNFPNESPQ